jgi:predicted PurR-regulated permease PerM
MATAEPRSTAPAGEDRRGMADLLKELRDETTRLFRQEIELAKTEMSEKASRVGRNSAYLAVGGAIAYLGLAFILLGVMYLIGWGLAAAGLIPIIATWLAALIVGIVAGIVGYAMVQKGIQTLKRESVLPEQTVHSMRENKQWAQQKLK